MKKIRFLLIILSLISFISPLAAQSDESYTQDYKGHRLSVTYIPARHPKIKFLGYDGTELTKLISGLEQARDYYEDKLEKKDTECKNKQKQIDTLKAKLKNCQSQIQNQTLTKNQTPTQSIVQEPKRDTNLISLKRDILELQDQRDSLQGQVKLLNDSIRLLNTASERVYSPQTAMSQKASTPTGTFQHIGAYYRLGGLLCKETTDWEKDFFYQIGVYWNSASFSDKLPMTYGAGLEYIFLYRFGRHVLSIPLSFSIGTPRSNCCSGYFQVSLVPSAFFNGDKLPNFGLSGRLSGGGYIPLCSTANNQTSQWAVKVGVNLDMGVNLGMGVFENFYVNPGLEFGILYMFNK